MPGAASSQNERISRLVPTRHRTAAPCIAPPAKDRLGQPPCTCTSRNSRVGIGSLPLHLTSGTGGCGFNPQQTPQRQEGRSLIGAAFLTPGVLGERQPQHVAQLAEQRLRFN